MGKNTHQETIWKSNFGKEYTDRNTYDKQSLNELYKNTYGITRTEMNEQFIGNLDKSFRVLEVGCNVGNQLLCLQEMGFNSLYGIELQEYAVELSKSRTAGINIIQGSAFDIPFKDNFFDLVFTSGVLIHISPDDINQVLSEIIRCSGKFIFGFEYYSESNKSWYETINYRGNESLLWKGNYAKSFLQLLPELELVKQEKFRLIDSDNETLMFLLQKKQ